MSGETGAEPLVSVLIPVYNGEAFLAEAIASALVQTHRTLEVLVVDDGSTDGSAAVALEFTRRDPRVRYLTHPGGQHLGTSATRTLGIRESRGEYVAPLDADDVWLPAKVERQVAELRGCAGAAFLVAPILEWYSWTHRPEDAAADRLVSAGHPAGASFAAPELLTILLRRPDSAPWPTSLLVTREAMLHALPEPDFPDLYEDQVWYAKLCLAHTGVASGACLARYRRHSQSTDTVGVRAGREPETRVRFLEWLERFLDSERVHEEALRQALAEALRDARAVAASHRSAGPGLPRRAVSAARAVARRVLPAPARRAARRALTAVRGSAPAVGGVQFGDLRRLSPLCDQFGYSRGGPIDRVYIEGFLDQHREDVRGRALEVGDATYLFRFGGDRLTSVDVLHVDPANPFATIVANLEDWPDAPEGRFDVIVFTQTLHLIYDVRGALATLHRLLAPGGVLLMTVPGISQIDRETWGSTWYWAMTSHVVTRLCADVFGPGRTEVVPHGNVLSASGFLYGLGAGELRPEELATRDLAYQVVVTARAVKGPL